MASTKNNFDLLLDPNAQGSLAGGKKKKKKPRPKAEETAPAAAAAVRALLSQAQLRSVLAGMPPPKLPRVLPP